LENPPIELEALRSRIGRRYRAFPNAYLEVDEPPNRFPWERIAALVAAIGPGYFGLVILVLSFIDTEFNPISQAASDYGVGRFAPEMNLGFFLGGIGLIAFAWSIGRREAALRSRAGSILFFIAGLVLIVDSYFTTNVEGAPATLHGLIHGFGGFVFFTTAPVGVILISRKFGRRGLLVAVLGMAIGFFLLAINAGLSGLAERAIILVIFSTVIASSLAVGNFSNFPNISRTSQ
jgi:hypothetical membrane protein